VQGTQGLQVRIGGRHPRSLRHIEINRP